MTPIELDLASTFVNIHPRSAARELELFSIEDSVELINLVSLEQGSTLILNMLPSYAARLCSELDLDLSVSLLRNSDVTHVLPILRCMAKPQRAALLGALPDKISKICRLLLSYSEDMVGAWMAVDIVSLPAQCTVDSAMKRLTQADAVLDCNVVPVLTEGFLLQGTVSVKDLINANKSSTVSTISRTTAHVLSSRASLSSSVQSSGWNFNDSLVVLNRNRQVVGLLQHRALRKALSRFGEKSDNPLSDDAVSSVAEAYAGSINALLSLVCQQGGSPNTAGEKR